MEELQSMLIAYNKSHQEDLLYAPWSRQFCKNLFPTYWRLVYDILEKLDRELRVLEVGCGLGDVTSIPCYLDFKSIVSFEKIETIGQRAILKIEKLFGKQGVIQIEEFPSSKTYIADILLVVNCAYADLANNKDDYMSLMKSFYLHAGEPKYYILEVIDASYTKEDNEFPTYIRLCKEDIQKMFPNHQITSWPTYVYPTNKKSKTLYLIEK